MRTMQNEDSHLNESLRKIAKGASIILIGTFIGRMFGYLSRMVIARFLGASDYGLIALGFAVMSIAATLALVGTKSGIIRYISFYKGKEDMGRIKGTIISSLKITLPLSLVLTFILFWYANWISIHVFHDGDLTPIIRIFAIGIPFFVLTRNLLSATFGFQEVKYQVYTENIFKEPLKLLAIVVFLLLGYGVVGAAWGWLLAIVVVPFLAFYFLEKKVFPIFKTKVKAISMDKELFYFSFPLLFAGIAGLIMSWTDTLMLGYFSSSEDVGIYNVALPTAQLIGGITAAFATIFFPVVSELYARNKIEDVRRTYNVVTKWMLMLMFPTFLLTALFPEQIIKILFGAEYITGATALSILVCGYVIHAAVGPTGAILRTYKRTKTVMMVDYIGATMNFLLNFLLIPIYGVSGAAIATGFSLAFVYILTFVFAYKAAKIQPFQLSHLKIILASSIAVFVVYSLMKYVTGVSLFVLIPLLSVFLLFYFFLLIIMKSFEEEDLMIMRAINQRLGIRSNWVINIIKRFL